METNTLWAALVGGTSAWAAFLIGGVDNLFKAFVTLMILDYILGIMAAYVNKNIDSKRAFVGLLKKTSMVMMVIAAVQLDTAVDAEGLMRNAMVLFLVGMEGISFVENLGHMGINPPNWVKEAFSQLQDKGGNK